MVNAEISDAMQYAMSCVEDLQKMHRQGYVASDFEDHMWLILSESADDVLKYLVNYMGYSLKRYLEVAQAHESFDKYQMEVNLIKECPDVRSIKRTWDMVSPTELDDGEKTSWRDFLPDGEFWKPKTD